MYLLKVLPEKGKVLFYLLRILFAYDDSFHELGDFSPLTLLHAQPGYLGGPLVVDLLTRAVPSEASQRISGMP